MFNPGTSVGVEITKVRPCVIVSHDRLHRTGAGIVVPITSNIKGLPFRYRVDPPEGGLAVSSEIMCDQVRGIDLRRLKQQVGVLTEDTMAEVETRLRTLMSL